MKDKTIVILAAAICFLTSCKKDATNVSLETIALLRNNWTLISSTLSYPTNPSLNAKYIGAITDFYQFGFNDTLKIRQSGSVNVPSLPVSLNLKYSFVNDRTIIYNSNQSEAISIEAITNNLLVLKNSTSAAFNNGTTVVNYEGTKTDSLRR